MKKSYFLKYKNKNGTQVIKNYYIIKKMFENTIRVSILFFCKYNYFILLQCNLFTFYTNFKYIILYNVGLHYYNVIIHYVCSIRF